MIETILIEKLRSYIIANNLDLLLNLQQDFSVTRYLEDKVSGISAQLQLWAGEGRPQYVIEELALNELTKDLRPSKFHYIREVLEEEFPDVYNRFREMGVLTYEIINLIEGCRPVFEQTGFTEENESDRHLRYAVTGSISEYLEKK